MSEWDKLWEVTIYPQDVDTWTHLAKIKAEGDRLQKNEEWYHKETGRLQRLLWDSNKRITEQQTKLKETQRIAEEALDTFNSINGAYELRTHALQMILEITKDDSLVQNTLKALQERISEIEKEYEDKLEEIKGKLNNIPKPLDCFDYFEIEDWVKECKEILKDD